MYPCKNTSSELLNFEVRDTPHCNFYKENSFLVNIASNSALNSVKITAIVVNWSEEIREYTLNPLQGFQGYGGSLWHTPSGQMLHIASAIFWVKTNPFLGL